jgi:hypothetical protein
MTGNRGIGGVVVPPRRASLPEADPLAALTERDLALRFRAAAEEVCGAAIERARAAESKADGIEGRLRLIIGMLGTALLMAAGAFVWLFQQQQALGATARADCQREARSVVLEADRRIEEKLRAERTESCRTCVKQTLEEQSRIFAAQKDPDRITASLAPAKPP